MRGFYRALQSADRAIGKALDKDWVMAGIGAVMIYELVRVIIVVQRIWSR